MIQEERIQDLSQKSLRNGRYVLYWVQAAPRVTCNHAYQYAVRKANGLSLPLLACFNLTPGYPEAERPHYRFMIEGLLALSQALKDEKVQFVILTGAPGTAPLALGGDAALVVTDRGYLRFQELWREQVAAELECPLIQVETNVVVPVSTASPKEEWSAATFRTRITPQIERFLVPLEQNKPARSSLDMDAGSVKELTAESLLSGVFGDTPAYIRLPAARSSPLEWR